MVDETWFATTGRLLLKGFFAAIEREILSRRKPGGGNIVGRTMEQKQERLQLLNEQTRLSKSHCNDCEHYGGRQDKCRTDCQIGQQLFEIGNKLLGQRSVSGMNGDVKSYRMSPEELEDYRARTGYKPPTTADGGKIKPPVLDKSNRSVRQTTAEPDKIAFLKSIAEGNTIAATEKAFGMKPNAIYAWLKKWELTGIKPEKAREMLGTAAPKTQEPVLREKELPSRVEAAEEVQDLKSAENDRLKKLLESAMASSKNLESKIEILKEQIKEEASGHGEAIQLLNETKRRLNEAEKREEALKSTIAELESDREMLLSTVESAAANDHVNLAGSIETIDIIRATMSPEMFEGYCLGNVIKYTTRYRSKNGVEDMRKAEQYMRWMIEAVDGQRQR